MCGHGSEKRGGNLKQRYSGEQSRSHEGMYGLIGLPASS